MLGDNYVPKQGDIIWMAFTTHSDRTDARPVLVISHEKYNEKAGLLLACPLTSNVMVKGYPFAIETPADCSVSGVILADQVKSLNWKARKSSYICSVPESTMQEVLQRIRLIVGL